MHDGFDTILTHDALEFLAQLHRKFDGTRRSLMAARETLQKQIDAGQPIKVRLQLVFIDCSIFSLDLQIKGLNGKGQKSS